MRFEDQLGVQMFAAAHLRAEDRVARAKAACTFKDYTFYIRRLFQRPRRPRQRATPITSFTGYNPLVRAVRTNRSRFELPAFGVAPEGPTATVLGSDRRLSFQ